jgi:hypothetical protein
LSQLAGELERETVGLKEVERGLSVDSGTSLGEDPQPTRDGSLESCCLVADGLTDEARSADQLRVVLSYRALQRGEPPPIPVGGHSQLSGEENAAPEQPTEDVAAILV